MLSLSIFYSNVLINSLIVGETFRSLAYQFRIAHNTISEIIPEVLDAIYYAYKDEYLKLPTTSADWIKIAQEFEDMWQFPHCLGAIDGKHVRILCPKHSGSAYFNYKGFYSVVMLAIVRADLSFIYVDVDTNGRQNDSSIWNSSTIKQAIDGGHLNFPAPRPLQDGRQPCPYVFVSDEGIGMNTHIMRPYPFKQLTNEKRIFNYRLSRARRTVENAFGILSSVWRVFSSTILLSPEKVTKVILTCCVLHNMLRNRKVRSYLTVIPDTNTGQTNTSLLQLQTGRNLNPATITAKSIRNEFANFFSTSGEVEWQWKYANNN